MFLLEEALKLASKNVWTSEVFVSSATCSEDGDFHCWQQRSSLFLFSNNLSLHHFLVEDCLTN